MMATEGIDAATATGAVKGWMEDDRRSDAAALYLAEFSAEWGDDRDDLKAALADFIADHWPEDLPGYMAPLVTAIVAAADLSDVLDWLDEEGCEDED
jgi:hypothetical protein